MDKKRKETCGYWTLAVILCGVVYPLYFSVTVP